MRRLIAGLALTIGTLAPGLALADVRATYRDNRGGTMVVEAADNGASRIEATVPPEAASFGITAPVVTYTTPDGAYFVIVPTANGRWIVNVADAVAVANELTERYLPAILPVPAEVGQLRFRAAGEETVGGRRGTRYVFDFPKPPVTAGQLAPAAPPPLDFVVSNDQALEPIARASAPAMDLFRNLLLFRRMGMTPFLQQMNDVFREGTLLRAGREFVLTNVEQVTIDPARYQVPGTPVSRAEIRTFLERLMGTIGATPPPPTVPPAPPALRK